MTPCGRIKILQQSHCKPYSRKKDIIRFASIISWKDSDPLKRFEIMDDCYLAFSVDSTVSSKASEGYPPSSKSRKKQITMFSCPVTGSRAGRSSCSFHSSSSYQLAYQYCLFVVPESNQEIKKVYIRLTTVRGSSSKSSIVRSFDIFIHLCIPILQPLKSLISLVAEKASNMPKKKNNNLPLTAKFKKAPGAPRRFKSSFMFFSTEKHRSIREELKKNGETEKVGSLDVSRCSFSHLRRQARAMLISPS